MAKNNERVSLNIILPKGVAIYPKLNEPDTKFNPDGVYESKIRFDPEDASGVLGKDIVPWADLKTAVEAMRDAFAADKKKELMAGDGKAKKKAKELEVLPFGEEMELDDDGEETGNVILKAKMVASGKRKADGKPWSRRPSIFDAKGKKLDTAPAIWGGSELKLACEAAPYYTPKDNQVGITLRLEAVQIITLVSGGGGRSASAYGFEAEEGGYEAEDTPAFDGGGSDAEDDADF